MSIPQENIMRPRQTNADAKLPNMSNSEINKKDKDLQKNICYCTDTIMSGGLLPDCEEMQKKGRRPFSDKPPDTIVPEQ